MPEKIVTIPFMGELVMGKAIHGIESMQVYADWMVRQINQCPESFDYKRVKAAEEIATLNKRAVKYHIGQTLLCQGNFLLLQPTAENNVAFTSCTGITEGVSIGYRVLIDRFRYADEEGETELEDLRRIQIGVLLDTDYYSEEDTATYNSNTCSIFAPVGESTISLSSLAAEQTQAEIINDVGGDRYKAQIDAILEVEPLDFKMLDRVFMGMLRSHMGDKRVDDFIRYLNYRCGFVDKVFTVNAKGFYQPDALGKALAVPYPPRTIDGMFRGFCNVSGIRSMSNNRPGKHPAKLSRLGVALHRPGSKQEIVLIAAKDIDAYVTGQDQSSNIGYNA